MPGELSTILIRLEGVLLDAKSGRPRPGLRWFFTDLRKFRDIRVISEWPAERAERALHRLEDEGHIPRARRKRGALRLLVYAKHARPPMSAFGPPDRVVLIDSFPPRSDEDAPWTIRAPRIPTSLLSVLRELRWRAGVAAYDLMTSNMTYATTESATMIHRDPDILGGTPVFVGTRVPLQILIDHLVAGDSLDMFLEQFPSVTREQAVGAIRIAGEVLAAGARA